MRDQQGAERIALRLLLILLLFGCTEEKPSGPPPKRFEAVKRSARADKATTVFCEKAFDAGEKRFVSPPDQPVPGATTDRATVSGWRWINFWASWCGPCLQEMPLLKQWKSSFDQDGVPLSFELWSIDEDKAAFVEALTTKERFPSGQIRWLRSIEDLPTVLESLGVERDSAIPIHALVDPKGDLRCVRVGAVGSNDLGSIKSIIGS
jgi:thiol-disulfide isomerase/thioredoxin